MQEISSGIREALLEQGIEQLRIETRLSPAWTTDWMSAKGREALQGYGIAPPGEKAIDISGITRRTSDVEIGRASGREGVCQYVSVMVVAGPLTKKKNNRM